MRKSRKHFSVLITGSFLILAGCTQAYQWMQEQRVISGRLQEEIAHQSIPLRRELMRLDSRIESLTQYFVEAEELEREARFMAGLDVDAHEPLASQQILWDNIAHPISEANFHDLQLLIATTMRVAQLADKAEHTADSYGDVAAGMQADALQWATVPSITPVRDARQSSNFGRRRDPFTGKRKHHGGVDLVGPYGTAIYASAAGKVRLAGWMGSYGKLVEIDHGNGIKTRYGHNSRVMVRPGEHVRRGQVIARLGSTGRANAPHLHYEVLVDGRARNPGYVTGTPARTE